MFSNNHAKFHAFITKVNNSALFCSLAARLILTWGPKLTLPPFSTSAETEKMFCWQDGTYSALLNITSCRLPFTSNNFTLAFPLPNTTLVLLPSANSIVCVFVSKLSSKLTNFELSVIMWLAAPASTNRLGSSSCLLLVS